MAIRRHSETTNNSSDQVGTHASSSASAVDRSQEYQTADIKQVQRQYQDDAESKIEDKIDTGALLPKDMTVKLVRAETANLEIFLQSLYSFMLTLFGLFLGSWMSRANNSITFTNLESVATISFGVLSLCLIVAWICLKVKQSNQGIKIPYEILNQLSNEKAEQSTARDT